MERRLGVSTSQILRDGSRPPAAETAMPSESVE